MLVSGVKIKGVKEWDVENWCETQSTISFSTAMEEKYSFFIDPRDSQLYISEDKLKEVIYEGDAIYESPEWVYYSLERVPVISVSFLIKDETYKEEVLEFVRGLEAYIINHD